MGVTGSIQIDMSDVEYSRIIHILRLGGWTTGSEHIEYQHFLDPIEFGNYRYSAVANYELLLGQLDGYVNQGETVGIAMYWTDPSVRIEINFVRTASIYSLIVYFDGTRPTLPCCPPYTDYSWLLSRILGPLTHEHINILAVICTDNW